jgi:hypothetical protein
MHRAAAIQTRGFSVAAMMLLALALISASTKRAEAQTTPTPQLFFSDLDSGPNSGGESVSGFSGAYVTLYGNFFGASQGSSTVTWNGQNCLRVVGPTGTYQGWGGAHFWYQTIVVQLGSGCTQGSGNFVVTVNGQASNGLPFTVRAGRIFFVSNSGNDSNSGSFSSPWKTMPQCIHTIGAGDTCYVENGVATGTATDDFGAGLSFETGGAAGNPAALIAYPGATVTVGADPGGPQYAARIPNVGNTASNWTIAGISFIGPAADGVAMNPSGASNWRVVATLNQCPEGDGVGCWYANEMSGVKFYGNENTNISTKLGFVANKLQHALYFSSDTIHVDVGWNYIHDNMTCRAIQFHSSPLNGGGPGDNTGRNQFDLSVHDNFVYGDPCDGLNFGTVDPSQGRVEAYNNVIAHTGFGPSPEGGDSGDYSCIYMAYITNNGPVGGGTVEIYNNTLYDCGSFVASFPNNGSFEINGGEPTLLVRIRNNVMYQLGTEPFGNGGGWNSSYVSGSNNLFFSVSGQTPPSFTVANLTSDPLFFSAAIKNFELQTGSPAIDAGTTISGSNTYNNYLPWNGNPIDHLGVTRPQGTAFDIGAFEFSSSQAQRPNPPTGITASAK